jgi:hypothetical protein
MNRYLIPALLAALAPAGTAAAQDSAGVVVVHGNSYETALGMGMILSQSEKLVANNCWNLGCLVIVNDTSSYDLVGLYVNTAAPGRAARWSGDQIRDVIKPQKATLRFKTGGPDTCAMPVRFVLRQQQTHQKLEVEGVASLCTTPHEDAILRVQTREPRVILEDGVAN